MRRSHPLRATVPPHPSSSTTTTTSHRRAITPRPSRAFPERVATPTVPASRGVPTILSNMPFPPTPEAGADRGVVGPNCHGAETQHQGAMGQDGRTQGVGNRDTHGGGRDPLRGAGCRPGAPREAGHGEKRSLEGPGHSSGKAGSVAEGQFLLEGLVGAAQRHPPHHERKRSCCRRRGEKLPSPKIREGKTPILEEGPDLLKSMRKKLNVVATLASTPNQLHHSGLALRQVAMQSGFQGSGKGGGTGRSSPLGGIRWNEDQAAPRLPVTGCWRLSAGCWLLADDCRMTGLALVAQ